MRLERLSVRNHTRLPDLDADLRHQVILVGPNDVGKTSVLRCLHFVLGATVTSLYQNITAADVLDPDQPMSVTVWLVDLTDEERGTFPDEIAIAPDGSESLSIRLEVTAAAYDDEITIHRHFPEAGHNRPPSRDQLRTIGWQYLPALRPTGVDAIEGRASALRSMLATLDLGSEQEVLSDAVQSFNQVLHGSEKLGELRTSLAEHLSIASPRLVKSDDLVLRSAATGDEVLRSVGLYLDRDGRVSHIAEQSDGMNALVAMAFYDLSATRSNIVAIDEPETHLHPSSQRALAGLLTRGGNQKIISTHSPFIVQRFDPECVIAITSARKCRQLPSGSVSKTDKVMAQWWTTSRLEALTARFILFVEGLSDRVLVEAAASITNIDLDRVGVSIVELDGAANFDRAYKFFGPGGFGVDISGLVDDDYAAEWATVVAVPVADLSNTNIFVSKPDLEGEYVYALGASRIVEALTTDGVFSENQIARNCGISTVAAASDVDIARFCRKYKVQAALCVSQYLAPSDVGSMTGIAQLLSFLRTL